MGTPQAPVDKQTTEELSMSPRACHMTCNQEAFANSTLERI